MPGKPLTRGLSYVREYTATEDPNEHNDASDQLEHDDADGQSVIGISLGPEQKRLAAPSATQEQKVAALRRSSEQQDVELAQHDSHDRLPEDGIKLPQRGKNTQSTAVTLPSPWRAGPKLNWTNIDGAFDFSRKTNGSRAPSAENEETGWKRYIPSLPVLSKGASGTGKARATPSSGTPARSRAASAQSTPRANTCGASLVTEKGPRRTQNNSPAGSARSTERESTR